MDYDIFLCKNFEILYSWETTFRRAIKKVYMFFRKWHLLSPIAAKISKESTSCKFWHRKFNWQFPKNNSKAFLTLLDYRKEMHFMWIIFVCCSELLFNELQSYEDFLHSYSILLTNKIKFWLNQLSFRKYYWEILNIDMGS